MAPSKSVQNTTRIVSLSIAAKGDIEQAVTALSEITRALTLWGDELSTDPENLRQSAVGVQVEAMRAVMTGLTIRAASERLKMVSELASETKAGAT